MRIDDITTTAHPGTTGKQPQCVSSPSTDALLQLQSRAAGMTETKAEALQVMVNVGTRQEAVRGMAQDEGSNEA